MDKGMIIDIEPIEASGEQANNKATYEVPSNYANSAKTAGQGTYAQANKAQRVYSVRVETREQPTKKPSRLVGLLLMLIGVGCVIIGVPLLILPGPGLLMIFTGAALVIGGFRKLLGFGHTYKQNVKKDFNTNTV